jgi:hypothetical protein
MKSTTMKTKTNPRTALRGLVPDEVLAAVRGGAQDAYVTAVKLAKQGDVKGSVTREHQHD